MAFCRVLCHSAHILSTQSILRSLRGQLRPSEVAELPPHLLLDLGSHKRRVGNKKMIPGARGAISGQPVEKGGLLQPKPFNRYGGAMRVILRAFTANMVILLAVILAAVVLVLVTPTSRTGSEPRVGGAVAPSAR